MNINIIETTLNDIIYDNQSYILKKQTITEERKNELINKNIGSVMIFYTGIGKYRDDNLYTGREFIKLINENKHEFHSIWSQKDTDYFKAYNIVNIIKDIGALIIRLEYLE